FAVAESGDACCRGRVPQLHDPGDAGLWRALRLRRGRGVPVHAGMPGALPTNCTRSDNPASLDRGLGTAPDGDMAGAAAARAVAAGGVAPADVGGGAGNDWLLPGA